MTTVPHPAPAPWERRTPARLRVSTPQASAPAQATPDARRSQAASRSAFTLMELLIVISIIMILMGLVFVGVRLGREAARKAKTTQNITMLQAALSNYRSVNGHFPDDPALFTELQPMDHFNTLDDAQWKSVNEKLVIELKKSGASLDALITDGWKQPLRYRPSRLYPYKSAADAKADIDGDEPPARDEYQIWSKGPNTKDEGGGKKPETSDDIVSWPK